MTAENGKRIGSITEAMLVVQKANGIIPIAPCVQVTSEGQVKSCPNLDRKKLCTDPDGVISDGTVLQCPKQRGLLTLIDVNGSNKRSSVEVAQDHTVQALQPQRLSGSDRKERRPYFVR